MKQEDLERIKKKSITKGNENKRAYINGKKTSFKKGVVTGAIVGFAMASTLALGINSVKDALHVYPSDSSYVAAKESFAANHGRTITKQDFWVDFMAIADNYDPETMDFDSYIYAVYGELLIIDADTRLADMDAFINFLYDDGKTEYSNFLLYCKDKGFCDEVEGKFEINEKKYRQVLKEYIKSQGKKLEAEGEIRAFQGGHY